MEKFEKKFESEIILISFRFLKRKKLKIVKSIAKNIKIHIDQCITTLRQNSVQFLAAVVRLTFNVWFTRRCMRSYFYFQLLMEFYRKKNKQVVQFTEIQRWLQDHKFSFKSPVSHIQNHIHISAIVSLWIYKTSIGYKQIEFIVPNSFSNAIRTRYKHK